MIKILKEIKINKMFILSGKQYFLLSVYFTDTRTLLDMVSVFEPVIRKEIYIPQTYEEHLLESIEDRGNNQSPLNDIKVNGQMLRMTSRHNDVFTSGKKYPNIDIPDAFKEKSLQMIKYEFEPMESQEEIKQLSILKRDEIKYWAVQQEYTVPFQLNEDFRFIYTDPETLESKCLYIRKLNLEPIEDKLKNLFGAKDNESLLCAEVEFEANITEINLLTKERLKGGVNYTHAPLMMLRPLQDIKGQGLRGINMPISLARPEQKEFDIVLFSIAKKGASMEEIHIF